MMHVRWLNILSTIKCPTVCLSAYFQSQCFLESGVDQTAKIGVAGDSAGAQISASVCHTVKNIDFQVYIR
jgi:hypothetical protein